MAITRLQILNNKKSALMKQQIREIAKLLAESPPKEEKARIKAEALIRDDDTVEACEILALNSELLAERVPLISHCKACPDDLVSTVSTLLWASYAVDIPELVEVRKQFRYKFGKQFESDAMQNVGGCINERVAVKLSVQPPSAYRVQTYLERIADEHKVSWKPMKALTAESMAEPTAAPDGFSVQVGAGSGLVQAAEYSVTGNSNNNSGVGGGSHGRVSAPLLSPPPLDPSITTASRPHQQQQQLPQQHDLSRPHVPNVNPSDENDEVDIYIPGIASVRLEDDTTMEQGSSSCCSGSNVTMQNQDNYKDSNNGSNGREELNKVTAAETKEESAAGSSGFEEESYEDLAARFARLQR